MWRWCLRLYDWSSAVPFHSVKGKVIMEAAGSARPKNKASFTASFIDWRFLKAGSAMLSEILHGQMKIVACCRNLDAGSQLHRRHSHGRTFIFLCYVLFEKSYQRIIGFSLVVGLAVYLRSVRMDMQGHHLNDKSGLMIFGVIKRRDSHRNTRESWILPDYRCRR